MIGLMNLVACVNKPDSYYSDKDSFIKGLVEFDKKYKDKDENIKNY
jgi:hypothetical protein